jgi:hypothetical protein
VPSDVPGATVYATVLFDNVDDATHALSLNGDTLLGNKMVVRSWAKGNEIRRRHSLSCRFILQVATSFLSLPEAKRGVTPKTVHICGVNVTKFRFVHAHTRNRLDLSPLRWKSVTKYIVSWTSSALEEHRFFPLKGLRTGF